jgi:hypothetical protein
MPTSGTKWPEGYKGLVSAVKPDAPYLIVDSTTCNNSITLSWSFNDNNCIPISSYNIYQNGVIIQNVPYTTTSTTISDLAYCISYSFYITSLSNTTESIPSNTVFYGPNISTPSNISGIAGDTSCQISWSPPSITCVDSSIISYNGQVNGFPMVTNITSPHVFTGLTNGTTYTFNIYTVSIINGVTSISCPATITLTPNFYYTSNILGISGTSGGYKYVYFSNTGTSNIPANITFNLSNSYVSSVYVVCVGGGGGGGGGGNLTSSTDSGRGGGGAGCGVIQISSPVTNSAYTFNIGYGGNGGIGDENDGSNGSLSNLLSPTTTVLINCTNGNGGKSGPGGSTGGAGGQQTVPSVANFGGNGGQDPGDNGQNSNTTVSGGALSMTGLTSLPFPPFSTTYGGGGGCGNANSNGGTAGNYGTAGSGTAASGVVPLGTGETATTPGGGAGGAGWITDATNYSGGKGGPGLIGFWWQPLF